MRILILALVVLCAACGDPRQKFVGSYSGTEVTNFTYFDGETSSGSGPFSVTLTAPDSDDLLHFSGSCSLTAEVDGSEFNMNEKTCPPQQITYSDGTVCTLTSSLTAGTGSISGDTFNARYEGTGVVGSCSDGYTDSWTFVSTITAQRSAANGPPSEAKIAVPSFRALSLAKRR